MTAPLLYTVPDVCAALQISRATLHRITQPRGPLYAVRVGRSLRFPVEAVTAYLAGQPYDPGGPGAMASPDVATWPPTPSLLDADDPA